MWILHRRAVILVPCGSSMRFFSLNVPDGRTEGQTLIQRCKDAPMKNLRLTWITHPKTCLKKCGSYLWCTVKGTRGSMTRHRYTNKIVYWPQQLWFFSHLLTFCASLGRGSQKLIVLDMFLLLYIISLEFTWLNNKSGEPSRKDNIQMIPAFSKAWAFDLSAKNVKEAKISKARPASKKVNDHFQIFIIFLCLREHIWRPFT